MSAAILERARAFEMIAAFLSEERRAEIAEAIAEKILAEVKPRATWQNDPPAVLVEPAPNVDLSEATEIASFLADHGFERKALVDATLQLKKWLAANEGRFTRAAGMRIWLDQHKGAA